MKYFIFALALYGASVASLTLLRCRFPAPLPPMLQEPALPGNVIPTVRKPITIWT
jgi:hypothetical protein